MHSYSGTLSAFGILVSDYLNELKRLQSLIGLELKHMTSKDMPPGALAKEKADKSRER